MPTRPHAILLVAALLALAPGAAAGHEEGSGARSLGGATIPTQPEMLRLEAEEFALRDVGRLVEDPGATGGRAWLLDRYGSISTTVTFPQGGVVWLEVRARGTHPSGLPLPHLHPHLDDTQAGEWDLTEDYFVYRQSLAVTPGEHTLVMDNFNNLRADVPDRPIRLDWVRLSQPTLDGVPRVGEAERVEVDAPDIHGVTTGQAVRDEAAHGGTAWHLWGVGCFVEAVLFDHAGDYRLTSWLRGNEKKGEATHVTIHLDDHQVDELAVGDAWTARETALSADAGVAVLRVCYDNDRGGEEKRNLWLDRIVLERVGEAPPVDATPDGGGGAPTSPTEPTGPTEPTAPTEAAGAPDARFVPAPLAFLAAAAALLRRRR